MRRAATVATRREKKPCLTKKRRNLLDSTGLLIEGVFHSLRSNGKKGPATAGSDRWVVPPMVKGAKIRNQLRQARSDYSLAPGGVTGKRFSGGLLSASQKPVSGSSRSRQWR